MRFQRRLRCRPIARSQHRREAALEIDSADVELSARIEDRLAEENAQAVDGDVPRVVLELGARTRAGERQPSAAFERASFNPESRRHVATLT